MVLSKTEESDENDLFIKEEVDENSLSMTKDLYG